MQFSPDLCDLILRRKKTVTRRRMKWGGWCGCSEMPCRYEVGKTYAIQPGRGKKAVGRIRVISVDRQKLGRPTMLEARLEGFLNPHLFVAKWLDLYGKYDVDQIVDRIEFELVQP
jgi:hypothetical protein